MFPMSEELKYGLLTNIAIDIIALLIAFSIYN